MHLHPAKDTPESIKVDDSQEGENTELQYTNHFNDATCLQEGSHQSQ